MVPACCSKHVMCSGVFDYTPMLARQSVKVEDLRQHNYGVSFLEKEVQGTPRTQRNSDELSGTP